MKLTQKQIDGIKGIIAVTKREELKMLRSLILEITETINDVLLPKIKEIEISYAENIVIDLQEDVIDVQQDSTVDNLIRLLEGEPQEEIFFIVSIKTIKKWIDGGLQL